MSVDPSCRTVIVGRSARMHSLFEFLRVIADGTGTVLITGESGTGKEVIAQLIHEQSRRRRQPFVTVSCAVLNPTVIESELFGHQRGAFTDAVADHAGRFEQANGGTVFLDDIDDVPLPVQVKLLRVLQTHTVERLGGTRAVPIDLRVIAGSKHDLRQLVADGRFRDDLFYRLNVLPVMLPPLRERREDIPALMDHFLTRFFERQGRRVPSMSAELRDAFLRYSWPGNIRELENACERIAQTCTCGRIRAGCMPVRVLFQAAALGTRIPQPSVHPQRGTAVVVSLQERLRSAECHMIRWALQQTRGNKSRAAELLHIKRTTFADRLRQCHCDAERTDADGDFEVSVPA